jgi:hypothetical protein
MMEDHLQRVGDSDSGFRLSGILNYLLLIYGAPRFRGALQVDFPPGWGFCGLSFPKVSEGIAPEVWGSGENEKLR